MIEGNYETETETDCMSLTDRVARAVGVDMPEQPVNDPLQNTAVQVPGLGQNAYSYNSRYIPETEGVSTYKGSAAVHSCSAVYEYSKALSRVVNYAYTVYETETESESPPAYKWGTICSMTEKFGWKAGMIEDAVETKLLEIDGVEPVEEDIEDVPENEKAGWDIVVEVKGKTVGIQVKTGSRGRRKDEDYLVVVDAKVDSAEIEFTVEKV